MSGKPRKNKKYNPDKLKKPQEVFQLNRGEFNVLGMLQQTIESAQKSQAVFLSHLAGSKWGYAEDVKVGFAIDWKEASVRVDIQREPNEAIQETAGSDTMSESTK